MVLEELIAVLGWDIQGEEKLRRFQGSLERTTQQIGVLGVAAGTFVGTVAAQAFGRLADAIGSLPGEVMKTGMEFEKLGLQLEILEGSAAKATERMDWLRRFAIDTPLNLQQATDAYIRMKNFGLDPLDGSMQAIVDANALMGGSTERLSGIILALGQAWTKQKFQAEEANQLLERGVPVWELMAKATGKSTAELMKLSEKGKIGRAEIKLLIDQMGLRAKGASERFAKTLEGQLGKIEDLWIGFKKQIGDAGFYQDMQRRLNQLTDYFERLSRDGTLQRWAKKISDGFESAADGAVQVVSRLVRHFEAFSKWVKVNPDLWDKIKVGLMALAAITFPKTAAIMVLEDLFTFMEGGDSVIGKFAKSISELTGVDPDALGGVLGTIAGSAAGLTLVSGPMKSVAVAIRALSSALGLIGSAASASGLGVLSRLGLISGSAAVLTGATYKAIKDTTADVAMVNKQGPAKDYSEQYSREENAARWWKQFGDTHFEGGWHRVGAGAGPAPGKGYAASTMLDNAGKNFARMGSGAAAATAAVTNDNRGDRSVHVNITQNIQQASQAPGAAAQATANYVKKAAGAPMAPWHIMGEKF